MTDRKMPNDTVMLVLALIVGLGCGTVAYLLVWGFIRFVEAYT